MSDQPKPASLAEIVKRAVWECMRKSGSREDCEAIIMRACEQARWISRLKMLEQEREIQQLREQLNQAETPDD